MEGVETQTAQALIFCLALNQMNSLGMLECYQHRMTLLPESADSTSFPVYPPRPFWHQVFRENVKTYVLRSVSPYRMANTAACVRSETPSLLKMELT